MTTHRKINIAQVYYSSKPWQRCQLTVGDRLSVLQPVTRCHPARVRRRRRLPVTSPPRYVIARGRCMTLGRRQSSETPSPVTAANSTSTSHARRLSSSHTASSSTLPYHSLPQTVSATRSVTAVTRCVSFCAKSSDLVETFELFLFGVVIHRQTYIAQNGQLMLE